MNKLKMRMKILKKYKTPFERQIGESVYINHNIGIDTILLNSKNEYNRCSIPRLALTLEKDDQIEEYENEQKEKELKRMLTDLKERLRMEGSCLPKGKTRRVKIDMTVPLKMNLNLKDEKKKRCRR